MLIIMPFFFVAQNVCWAVVVLVTVDGISSSKKVCATSTRRSVLSVAFLSLCLSVVVLVKA